MLLDTTYKLNCVHSCIQTLVKHNILMSISHFSLHHRLWLTSYRHLLRTFLQCFKKGMTMQLKGKKTISVDTSQKHERIHPSKKVILIATYIRFEWIVLTCILYKFMSSASKHISEYHHIYRELYLIFNIHFVKESIPNILSLQYYFLIVYYQYIDMMLKALKTPRVHCTVIQFVHNSTLYINMYYLQLNINIVAYVFPVSKCHYALSTNLEIRT